MEPKDLFQLRRGLVEAGFKDEAAENIAVALESAVGVKLDEVMAKWEEKFDLRFKAIETRFDGQINVLRTEMGGQFMAVRGEISALRHEMTVRLGAMIVATVSLGIAAIRLWP